MKRSAFLGLLFSSCLCFSQFALAGFKTFLDPRSMAMGGTGVASATKINAPFHNPALLAFNRGWKPDDVVFSASLGLRETYKTNLERDIREYQESDIYNRFLAGVGEAVGSSTEGNVTVAKDLSAEMLSRLRRINLSSYRSDESSKFAVLIDTKPITASIFSSQYTREMTVIRNQDINRINELLVDLDDGDGTTAAFDEDDLRSSVDNTYYQFNQWGLTVSTTEFVGPNMPISWGFSPKLIEITGSHISLPLEEYDTATPPNEEVNPRTVEWNVDVGTAILLSDEFLRDFLGFGETLRNGEWVVAMTVMNLLPTDIVTFGNGRDAKFPMSRITLDPQIQMGFAHYRQDFMITMDFEWNEKEIFDFEGYTRFLSIGGEYYFRDDFHLRAGVRFNTSQTSEAGQDKAVVTGGFIYQPRGFWIEAAAMGNDVEFGGTVELGIGF